VPLRIADRYEIRGLLGQGGMGVVYCAYDAKTKSDVALKTMRDVSDPAAVEMFEKEWALLAGISHPNIIDIRDVGEITEDGRKKPFFVMPLLRGATLAALIEESSARLTVERIVGMIGQVCRGLQVAHDHGLIHRDIKPSNIFVMEDDTVKIIDFGVVHLAGTRSITGHKGTWQYMAPEQVDLKPATPSSDVFSVGVVCYEALTGKRPFARPTAVETAQAVRKYIAAPAFEINSSVSQLLSMVVHKAMAKEPIHRFVSAREFGDTLQRAFLNQPIERFDPARIQPRIERAKKALLEGDEGFAGEILAELEAEGNIGQEISVLRGQIEQRTSQKKIRLLLETARTRAEQDEIPLALEKIQEVLGVDPENSEALTLRSSIEKRRNERQIESWMALARRHLDRHDFAEARQALREVLRMRPSDGAAGDLLAETDRREQQSQRIRNEREQLYGSAMRAYQNGEVSSALNKLERLLELGNQTPGASVPERDAIYQGLYNQVRTERDAIQNAYAAVRRNLAEKAFARGLEICDEFAAKYPNDTLFQALRLEAVEQQRQEQSAYIAEVGRRADAEPDLDRKVNILKEACERYPAEQQFQTSLKITRERRDLILSIVGRARQYEERNQFAEALAQWDILRNIYPRYPGIDVEIEQLAKRREDQARDESKARLVETIDQALDSSDFARALDLAAGALAENPQDAELAALAKSARERFDRASRARTLLADGQQLMLEKRFGEAAVALRRAALSDPKSTLIRDCLVNSLVEQARAAVDVDWRQAEPLIQEACDLDANHPGVRSLRGLIADSRRKELVPQCLAEARDLQSAGDLEGALEKIAPALKQFPNDVRLSQAHASLKNAIRDLHQEQERKQDLETLQRLRQDVEAEPAPDKWESILELSQSICRKYPDDQHIGAVGAEIRQRADVSHFETRHDPIDSRGATPVESTSRWENVRYWASSALGQVRARVQRSWTNLRPKWIGLAQRLRSVLRPAVLMRSKWGPIALILLIAAIAIPAALVRHPAPSRPKPVAKLRVELKVAPVDAVVTVDGHPRSGFLDGLDPRATYDVRASKLGYQEYQAFRKPEPEWRVSLSPAPVHLSVATGEKTGQVFLDGSKQDELVEGNLQDVLVTADGKAHTIEVKNGPATVLAVIFMAEAGRTPIVQGMPTKDVQVVASLGPTAILYNSTQGLRGNLTGRTPEIIPKEGLPLGLTDMNHAIAFDSKDSNQIPVSIESFPALEISYHAKQMGTIRIECEAADAQLSIDDKPFKRPRRAGAWTVPMPPGDHAVKIAAPGFDAFARTLAWKQGETQSFTAKLDAEITTATLEIQEGTPLASVYVDNEARGELDNGGAAAFDNIQAGRHTVRMHKDSYEDRSQELLFAARQHVVLRDKAKLTPFGSLSFQVIPANATITYRRSDQSEPRSAGNQKFAVPAGRYSVSAKLPGYESKEEDFQVESGSDTPITWTLLRIPPKIETKVAPVAEPVDDFNAFNDNDRKLFDRQDGWLALKKADWVFLKDQYRRITFRFSSANKKKIVWAAHYVDTGNRIEYELDGKGVVTRRIYSNKVETKPNGTFHVPWNADIMIVMQVQKDKIVILDSKGNEINSFTAEGQDLTTGKIGIKGKIEYLSVRVQ
jgi:serine/threonine protein kinase